MRVGCGVVILRRQEAALTSTAPTSSDCSVADVEVLLLRRVKDGEWTRPGGAVEIGETFLEAVLREVREEVGVDFVPIATLGGEPPRRVHAPLADLDGSPPPVRVAMRLVHVQEGTLLRIPGWVAAGFVAWVNNFAGSSSATAPRDHTSRTGVAIAVSQETTGGGASDRQLHPPCAPSRSTPSSSPCHPFRNMEPDKHDAIQWWPVADVLGRRSLCGATTTGTPMLDDTFHVNAFTIDTLRLLFQEEGPREGETKALL